MTNNIDEIKNGIFAELKIWDEATEGDCDETETLLNFYNLWDMIWSIGWGKEYEAIR